MTSTTQPDQPETSIPAGYSVVGDHRGWTAVGPNGEVAEDLPDATSAIREAQAHAAARPAPVTATTRAAAQAIEDEATRADAAWMGDVGGRVAIEVHEAYLDGLRRAARVVRELGGIEEGAAS